MAPIGKLWGFPSQRQTKVILSVAALNGFELELPEWWFTNQSEDYTSKFPYRKVPAFESADGFRLIEGAAIARYLSGMGIVDLLGSTPIERAIVDQWVHFAEDEIATPTSNIHGLVYGHLGHFDDEIVDKNLARILRALNHIEKHLSTRPSSSYFALDTLTLADLMLVAALCFSSSFALGTAERMQFPKIFALYDRVAGDERLKAYFGKERFVEERLTEATPVPTS